MNPDLKKTFSVVSILSLTLEVSVVLLRTYQRTSGTRARGAIQARETWRDIEYWIGLDLLAGLDRPYLIGHLYFIQDYHN